MAFKIQYAWAMRNKQTFKCKVIRDWANQFFEIRDNWVDPFYGKSPFKLFFKNDLAESKIDSHDWLKDFNKDVFGGAFFDPPYSMEQVKRSYGSVGIKGWQSRGNKNGNFPLIKDELARTIAPGGFCLSFGWNSTGLGMSRGFKKFNILLVAHGGGAHDTICVAERKECK